VRLRLAIHDLGQTVKYLMTMMAFISEGSTRAIVDAEKRWPFYELLESNRCEISNLIRPQLGRESALLEVNLGS
jgi:hypothetical protein